MSTSQGEVAVFCSWEGKHRSGIASNTHQTAWRIYQWAQWTKEAKHIILLDAIHGTILLDDGSICF